MEAIDRAAIEMVQSGDEEAFRGLVERHSRRVFSLAYRLTGSEADSEDVVQETFIRVHRQLSTFESRSRFSTWLHRVAVNCAYDLMRKRKRHVEGREEPTPRYDPLAGLSSAQPSAERLLRSDEIGQRVREALDRLTPQERTAFVLRHFEGQSTRQIARQLGLKDNAAKHSVFRAVQKLRQELRPFAGARS